jgi:hypothetical protein
VSLLARGRFTGGALCNVELPLPPAFLNTSGRNIRWDWPLCRTCVEPVALYHTTATPVVVVSTVGLKPVVVIVKVGVELTGWVRVSLAAARLRLIISIKNSQRSGVKRLTFMVYLQRTS